MQSEINKALSTIFQDKIETIGSGRTDAGVHAKEQVFHFDLLNNIVDEKTISKMNGVLPNDIIVNKILAVDEEAHARFDATKRSYEYHIFFKKTPFRDHEYHFLPRTPDFGQMKMACELLLGNQDFTSFSKVKTEVNNFYCQIDKADWQFSDEKAVFNVTANRFLRGMVRALVGTLLDIGYGKINSNDLSNIIAAKDRTRAGQSVPPQGLYLCNIIYPLHIFKN